MKYLSINQWDDFTKKQIFIESLHRNNNSRAILFGQDEWEYEAFFSRMLSIEDMVKITTDNNILVDIITGRYDLLNSQPYGSNVKIHYWDNHWIIKTYALMNSVYKLNANIKSKELATTNSGFKYHFISMNHRTHPWRCYMMDILAKNNLIANNAISWHNEDEGVVGQYDWKYYNPSNKLILDDLFTDPIIGKDMFIAPSQYYESFAQLISESNPYTSYISEKTAIPLILGKPFLVCANQGFHKYLKHIGFELYTEVFDYSFDNEVNHHKRFDGVIENFKQLNKIPLYQLKELELTLLDKIEHNRELVKKMVYDFDSYPDVIQEAYQWYLSTGVELDPFLHWYTNLRGL